jgi:hypothetical protein
MHGVAHGRARLALLLFFGGFLGWDFAWFGWLGLVEVLFEVADAQALPIEVCVPVEGCFARGEMIEPSVSEPMAKATHPAETALAEPAEEPLEP